MSVWSVQRQIGYFLLVLVFFAGVGGALFVLTRPDPSCSDSKRNQDETGIDCGGSCAAVCKNEIMPLRVLWSRVLKVSNGLYDSVTLIENPNLNLGLARLPYSIKFYDKDNIIIATREGETFSNPQENFIVFEVLKTGDVGARVPVRAAFEIPTNELVWARTAVNRPDLDFSSEVFTNEPMPTLRASVTNRSLQDLYNIEIKAVLFDERENTIGASATKLESLPRGTSQDLVFTWPVPFAEEPHLKILYPHFDFSASAEHL